MGFTNYFGFAHQAIYNNYIEHYSENYSFVETICSFQAHCGENNIFMIDNKKNSLQVPILPVEGILQITDHFSAFAAIFQKIT